MDTTAVKATVLLSSGRPSRNAITTAKQMANMGVPVRRLTLLQMKEAGKPLSLAKLQIILYTIILSAIVLSSE